VQLPTFPSHSSDIVVQNPGEGGGKGGERIAPSFPYYSLLSSTFYAVLLRVGKAWRRRGGKKRKGRA